MILLANAGEYVYIILSSDLPESLKDSVYIWQQVPVR